MNQMFLVCKGVKSSSRLSQSREHERTRQFWVSALALPLNSWVISLNPILYPEKSSHLTHFIRVPLGLNTVIYGLHTVCQVLGAEVAPLLKHELQKGKVISYSHLFWVVESGWLWVLSLFFAIPGTLGKSLTSHLECRDHNTTYLIEFF